MAKHILSRQGQSQTNSVKVKYFGNNVLKPTRCFAVVDFMSQGTTINSGAYYATLQKLQRVFQNKRRNTLSKRVLLQHDNARPYTSGTNWDLITILSVRFWTMNHTAATLLPAISTFSGTTNTVLAGSASVAMKVRKRSKLWQVY
ncbi:hypothetical protein TNCV_1637181 [Trichonephila clavipes]|nr:hypothetical protein TNCV_1637181 [Trichonephila clavipes]